MGIYTDKAESALKKAQRFSARMHHPYTGTEHILMGLLDEPDSTAGQVLAGAGVTPKGLAEMIDQGIVVGGFHAQLGEIVDDAVVQLHAVFDILDEHIGHIGVKLGVGHQAGGVDKVVCCNGGDRLPQAPDRPGPRQAEGLYQLPQHPEGRGDPRQLPGGLHRLHPLRQEVPCRGHHHHQQPGLHRLQQVYRLRHLCHRLSPQADRQPGRAQGRACGSRRSRGPARPVSTPLSL